MKLDISNFRSIKDKTYFFKEGITLIDGESGIGKTTIFEAIFWCLYGGKNVYPFTYDMKKKDFTSVQLEINDIIIYRKKPPDTVSITIKDNILVHDEAQSEINKIFGSQNYWESSSYLKQDHRNILMSKLGVSDKIEILKEIVFGINSEDLVEKYLHKTENYLKDKEKNIISLNSEVNYIEENFELYKENFKDFKDFEKYQKVYNNREKIISTISEINKKIEYQIHSSAFNSKLEEFRCTQKETSLILKKYPENLDIEKINKWRKYNSCKKSLLEYKDDFHFYEGNYEVVNKHLCFILEKQKKYNENFKICQELKISYEENIVSKELKSCEELIRNITSYNKYKESIENIDRINYQITNIELTLENLKKNKDDNNYIDSKTLEKEIIICNENIKYKNLLEKSNKERKCLLKLEEKKEKVDKLYVFLFTELKIKREKITDKLKFKLLDLIESCSGKHLECPECNTFLIKKTDILEKVNYKPFGKEKKEQLLSCLEKIVNHEEKKEQLILNIQNIESQIKILTKPKLSIDNIEEQLINLKEKLNFSNSVEKDCGNENVKLQALRETLNTFEIPEKIEKYEGDLNFLRNKCYCMKKIEFYNDYTEEIIEKEKELQLIKETIERRRLEGDIKENYLPDFDKFHLPEDYSSYLKDYQSNLEKNNFLRDYLDKHYEIEIKEVNENLEELKEKKKKYEKFEKICNNYEKYLEIKEKEKELNNKKILFKDEVEKKESATKIKKMIEEVSSQTLEYLIIELNNLLNEISCELFDDIIIELEMFKKIKNKNYLKPQFNLIIHLKGNTYDNISFLSGGEKDRISICLTLALSIISNNPIILLDECMSSLDEDMRFRVIKLVKKYTNEKIVISICHDSVQGYYDDILKL